MSKVISISVEAPLLVSVIGKDATSVFNGGVYNHTNVAHSLLSALRVAALKGGGEIESWKKPKK